MWFSRVIAVALTFLLSAGEKARNDLESSVFDYEYHFETRSLQGSGIEYYVKQGQGDNNPDGKSPSTAFTDLSVALNALNPGDTLYIMGTISNESYNPSYTFDGNVSDEHLWHSENTLRVNQLHGTRDQYITITSYENDPAIIKGDGANIVRISNSSFLRIVGLNIAGEVERISYETAKALQFVYRDADNTIQYRVDPSLTPAEVEELDLPLLGGNIPRVSYTDTRGLYMSNSHHVELRNNQIHHTPGNGLRVSYGEYVDIIANEVFACSRKSYSGTHGLVVTYTQDVLDGSEDEAGYRARIVRNVVHDNYNEIYSWVGTKPFIVARIDEGKGISLQRNQAFENGGKILVADNIAYGNGFSGIHSNDGDNVHMIGNTAYMNSYTNAVTYANDPAGNNIGISLSGGSNCIVANNIAVIDSSWKGLAISVVDTPNLVVTSNVLYGTTYPTTWKDDPDLDGIAQNTIYGDPLFRDADAHDFSLLPGSPALSVGNPTYSSVSGTDAFGNSRSSTNPAIGAVESAATKPEYEDNFCFSGENTVQLESGEVIAIPDLRVGDTVLVPGGTYERVYSFGHRDITASTQFVRLQTQTSVIELTPDHMIAKQGRFVPASIIEVGDVVSNDGGIVVSITTVKREGVYAPFTRSGTIVVSGVDSSSYISMQPKSPNVMIGSFDTNCSWQWVAHTFNLPHRVLVPFLGETHTDKGISIWVETLLRLADWVTHAPAMIQAVVLIPVLLLLGCASFTEYAFVHAF